MVKHLDHWGREEARKRYGKTGMVPKDGPVMEHNAHENKDGIMTTPPGNSAAHKSRGGGCSG